jgi:hypothetical protein
MEEYKYRKAETSKGGRGGRKKTRRKSNSPPRHRIEVERDSLFEVADIINCPLVAPPNAER